MFDEVALQFDAGGPAEAARSASGSQPDAAEDVALRDAEAIAARVGADEDAADRERERLTREPLSVLPEGPDMPIQLAADEVIHATRGAAIVERGNEQTPSGGTLYVTSRRLVHAGAESLLEVDLGRITDLAVSMERLLLIELDDGSDLAIEVDQPRLLRVQLAAARAAVRERA